MKRALILVDLQHDFLRAPGLEPAAGAVIAGAQQALAVARARGDLIVHVFTTVSRDDDQRMAHWRVDDRWMCERGTPGHASPIAVAPGDVVIDKAGFSPFVRPELDAALRRHGIEAVAIAGVHTHACVRQTALEAYQRGFATSLVDGAIGSDDPVHAAITRRYLEQRSIPCAPIDDAFTTLGTTVPTSLVKAKRSWAALDPEDRAARLDALADRLDGANAALVEVIVATIGKPITQARGEVSRAAALARAAARQVRAQPLTLPAGPRSRVVYKPLGLVLALTPYNNPVAIPVGKLAPALGFGNVVLWKPAPLGHAVAQALYAVIGDLFGDALALVGGDSRDARTLMADPQVDAVTLSGGTAVGHVAAEICARRRVPLQAELGGNNGAIVWGDADLPVAARAIAEGAFGFAGQRCTANRRVIVDASVHDAFVTELERATKELRIGDPRDPATHIGPMVSSLQAERVRQVIARADLARLTPHDAPPGDAWVAPTIVLAPHDHEITREETFGPVLVVLRAADWEHALALLDGVPQGLAAALFARSPTLRRDFLERARAGILKLDQTTADADAEAPFGGWKSSGIGPPEHGPGNAAFYLRPQAVYDL